MRPLALRSLVIGFTSTLLLAAGCLDRLPEEGPTQQGPTDRPGGDVAEGDQAIINGSPDTENDAVCALVVDGGGGIYPFCTGTIIAKEGSTAYAITAAHCLAPPQGETPDYLLCVDRYSDCPSGSCRFYPVTATAVHPEYDGGPGRDVAMLTLGQASDAPVIPALQSDGLAVGDPLEFSGYGVTNGFDPQSPSSQADERNHAFSVVGAIYLDAIEAPQSHSGQYGGTCFGDSGGPVLIGSGASKNIVGITSQGDGDCNQLGYYARIQYSWPFIAAIIGDAGQPTCLDCANDSLDGACAAQADTCNADTECNAFWTCVNGCTDQACYDGCAAQHPNGAVLYGQMIDCAFCQQCDAICQDPACGAGETTGTGASTGTGDATTGAGGGGGSGGGAGDDDDDDDDGDRADGSDGGETVTKCDCAVPGGAAPASTPAILVGIAFAAGLFGRRRRR